MSVSALEYTLLLSVNNKRNRIMKNNRAQSLNISPANPFDT